MSASPAPFGGLFLLERATHGPPVERIEAVDPFALLASTFNLSVRTPERLRAPPRPGRRAGRHRAHPPPARPARRERHAARRRRARAAAGAVSAMFAVGWGERAVELMARGAARADTGIEPPERLDVNGERTERQRMNGERAESRGLSGERAGPLAVSGAEGAIDAGGRWRCWISGRLTNARELCERFGLPPDHDLPALLARAYARVGPDACELLRGTFVVVAFDRERSTATIVRDHLGGRPLVHVRVGGGALFAEHERALVELLPSTPVPDRLALARWIERGSTPPGRTLFEGIRRIPPAHRVELSAGAIAIEPYWRPRYEGLATGSREAIAERLRDAAFAAVARAAEGAQRPAVRLSGGLDSACVAAGLAARGTSASDGLAARGTSASGGLAAYEASAGDGPAAQQSGALALAAVFPNHPATDERELIEATARHTGLSVELISFDDRASILAPALDHIARWSLPPVTPNMFVWRPLMASARELGVDVMLDGEGGDELFGWAPHLFADLLRRGQAAGRLEAHPADPGSRGRRRRAPAPAGDPQIWRQPTGARRRQTRGAGGVGPQATPGSLLAARRRRGARRARRGRGGGGGGCAAARRPAVVAGAGGGADRRGRDARRVRPAAPRVHRRADRPPPPLPVRPRAAANGARQPPRAAVRPGPRPRAAARRVARSHPRGGAHPAREELLHRPAARRASRRWRPARRGSPPGPTRRYARSCAREPLEALLREAARPRGARAARRLWHVGLADVWLRALTQPEYPRELLDRIPAAHAT